MARNSTPAPEAPAAETEAKDAAAAAAGLTDDGMVGQAIKRAVDLLDGKRKILVNLGETRQVLNIAANQGLCTPEQAEWIKTYLPKRTRNRNGASES